MGSHSPAPTTGQVEDSLAKMVTKFYAQTLGHGPQETRVFLIEDMILIRLKGRLFPLEEQLLLSGSGVGLVKDIRETLHEVLTQKMSAIITSVTHHSVISAHSDVSTKTGEMVEVFVLDTNYQAEIQKGAESLGG